MENLEETPMTSTLERTEESTPAETAEVDAPEQAAEAIAPPASEDTADLKSALEVSKANEAVLQRKVEALEAELATQQSQVDQLQAEAAAANQLKSELDEAKRVIMQLTELNAKLSEEAKTAAAPQPLAQAATRSAPAPAARKEVHPGHESSQTSQLELRRTLQSPPPLPGPAAPSISNDEIGWVD